MSRLLLMTALSAGLCVQASAQTFNERFDLFDEGNGQWAWGVEARTDGSALILFNGDYTMDSLYYSSGVSTVIVDSEGSFSEGFRLHVPERATYPGWANCASHRSEGGYIVGGSAAAVGDTNRATLYWLDELGIVTDYRELDLPGNGWIGRQAKQTTDGGYVVVGETSTVGVLDGFLAKTDAQGQVEWWHTFGSSLLREGLSSVEPAPWGGYYLGGQQEISAQIWKSWIVRVDGEGDLIGSSNYGEQSFGSGNAQLTRTPTGTIWVASSEYIGSGNNDRKAALYEVDEGGNVLWFETYGSVTRTGLFSVQPIPNSSDLIAVGLDDRMSLAGPLQGVLLRTTENGDSLWMRSYVYYDTVVGERNAALYDMQPTFDGGFIAVGVALAVPGEYTQDVWVVKVDSMGCLEPGCNTIMGMETQITNLRGALTVAPNPASSGGTVALSLNLPQGFSPDGSLRLTLVDAQGRLVREELIASASSPFTLSLAHMQAGLYHLHLSDATRWISGAKLMVE